MNVVTNNSLTELIKLVKAQSKEVFNATVNYTINAYTPMAKPETKKQFYADIPCEQSKVTMNCQISPNNNVKDVGLLTYAEPMNGFVRCYFKEQPTDPYIIDSIELISVIPVGGDNSGESGGGGDSGGSGNTGGSGSDAPTKKLSELSTREKIKFSNGQKYILMNKNLQGHEANSVTLSSEYIIEDAPINGFYLNSVVHTEIMPRYYNELNAIEKNALINRSFTTYNGETSTMVTAKSYFWIPTVYEYCGNGSFEDTITQSGVPIGFESDQDRVKTYENKTAGQYHTRSSRYLGDWNFLYIAQIGIYSNMPSQLTAGLVPACDVKGDTLVKKDTDGYWVITK